MALSTRELAIVTLLAQGRTDTEVAAHLGISVRTIAGSVSGLMKRYGAKTRFQLGIMLAITVEAPDPPTRER